VKNKKNQALRGAHNAWCASFACPKTLNSCVVPLSRGTANDSHFESRFPAFPREAHGGVARSALKCGLSCAAYCRAVLDKDNAVAVSDSCHVALL